MKKWIWLLILIPVLSLAQNKKAALEAQKKRLQQEIVQINALIKTSAKKRANVLTQVETVELKMDRGPWASPLMNIEQEPQIPSRQS